MGIAGAFGRPIAEARTEAVHGASSFMRRSSIDMAMLDSLPPLSRRETAIPCQVASRFQNLDRARGQRNAMFFAGLHAAAGIVQIALSRSTSAQVAPITSPVRAAVRIDKLQRQRRHGLPLVQCATNAGIAS